jgi:hypothetical protein
MLNANSKKVLNTLSKLARDTGENFLSGVDAFAALDQNGVSGKDAETAMDFLEKNGYLHLSHINFAGSSQQTLIKVYLTEKGKDLKGFRKVDILQYFINNSVGILALIVAAIALIRTFLVD